MTMMMMTIIIIEKIINNLFKNIVVILIDNDMSRDSAVGIATGYGLDD
jgi:hypothetical protein